MLALKLEFRTKRIAPAAAGKKSPHDYIGAANAVSNFLAFDPLGRIDAAGTAGTMVWQNSYARTKDWLHPILRGAYTGGEEADSTRLPTA